MSKEKWDYLEKTPKDDAPISDNPSNMYCPDCRSNGVYHCSSPEYCGGMKLMKPKKAVKE